MVEPLGILRVFLEAFLASRMLVMIVVWRRGDRGFIGTVRMELDDAGLFVIEPDGDVLAHDRKPGADSFVSMVSRVSQSVSLPVFMVYSR
jgi:hypothetical protein